MPSAGREIGLSGLVYDRGEVNEEIHPSLQGRLAIGVFREMSENDPVIGAIMYAIDRMLRQVEWGVEPNSEGNEEDAEFLESCMHDMSLSWSDFISEVLSMLTYGWSYFEVVYKRRNGWDADPHSNHEDGKIGWRKFAFRSQDSLDRWEFDNAGGIKAMVQKTAPDYEDKIIPIEKSLLFRTTSIKNNPEGRSLLRNAYRPWFYKKRVEEIEGVGVERDLAGLPVARIPSEFLASTATEEQRAIRNAIQQIVQNVKMNRQAGLLWPGDRDEQGNPLFEFELMSSGGSRLFPTGDIIERYDRRITMTVLADFIMLGHQNVGSFALSSDKTNLFAVALGSFLQNIEDTLNRFAVPRLFRLNGMSVKNLPQIKHGDIEKPDIAAIASYLSTLGTMGMPLLPDETLEKYLRDIAGLPEPSPEAQEEFRRKQEEEAEQLQSQQEPEEGEEVGAEEQEEEQDFDLGGA